VALCILNDQHDGSRIFSCSGMGIPEWVPMLVPGQLKMLTIQKGDIFLPVCMPDMMIRQNKEQVSIMFDSVRGPYSDVCLPSWHCPSLMYNMHSTIAASMLAHHSAEVTRISTIHEATPHYMTRRLPL